MTLSGRTTPAAARVHGALLGRGFTRIVPAWLAGSLRLGEGGSLSSRFHFPHLPGLHRPRRPDKPRDYPKFMDLRANRRSPGTPRGIAQTVVAAFDYCIVSLELLARRIDRERAGNDRDPNHGLPARQRRYLADGHTHGSRRR